MLSSAFLHAQEYVTSLKHWDIKDGLSHRQVNAIYHTDDGFMWLCTKNGLCRFDGYDFTAYTAEKDGLPFNDCEKCMADVNGNLWVMAGGRIKNNNVFIFNPKTRRVTTFRDVTGSDTNVQINSLRRMNDGTMFLGVNNDFFLTWHPRQGLRKVNYPFAARKLLTSPETNSFFVVNYAGEMCELDMHGKVLGKIKVDFIPNERHPNIPGEGMYVSDSTTRSVFYISPEKTITKPTFLPLLQKDNGDVIFNTGHEGLIWRQGQLYQRGKGVIRDFFREGETGLRGRIRDVYIDEDGRIWMCTDFGLYMLTINKNKFQRYFHQDEKTSLHNSFRNIWADGDDIYASNEFTGIMYLNKATGVTNCSFKTPTLSLGYYSLKKISGNRLLGVNYHYLYLKEPNSAKWSFYKKPEGMPLYSCWEIHALSADSLLLGNSFGLQILDIRTKTLYPFTQYNKYDELKTTLVLYIAADKDGSRWICSNAGLYRYDLKKGITERYSSTDKGRHFLPAMEFQHYCQDSSDTYWFATGSGLLWWNKKSGKHRLFTQNDGLSNSNIYAVYDDKLGYLWLSSDYGIMRFNKATQKTRTFLTTSGITHNEFNRASHFRDPEGILYFGSLDGITSFDPKKFLSTGDHKGALLTITSFEQFNGARNELEDKTNSLLTTKSIKLYPDDRFFTINFALLTYNDVEYNTYYWRIDGIDAGWNSMKEHVLRLSRLPYGNHKLHIKAQAGDGSWSRNELQFDIITLKPYYLETWFIVLCGLGLLSLSAFWYRYRIWKLKRENIRLDWIIQEKTSALEQKVSDLKVSSEQKNILMKEIHHRVKNNLQVISVLLKLQLANVTDAEARRSIEASISRVSSIALIHQYLYKGDELTSIEISSFATELFRHVGEVYKTENQQIALQNEIPGILLDIDTAIPLGLILNELMVNSYKYSYSNGRNGTMQITLTRDNSGYVLKYCDNGPGLPEDFIIGQAGSLGMIIINSLSQQLQGKADYQRNINCFCIHFKDTQMRKKTA